jgi:hypothetical protein
MPRSEALKAAQKRYMEKIKRTDMGARVYERVKAANREAFRQKYLDPEFREKRKEYCRMHAYYRDYEDGTLRALRRLFGDR